MNAAQLVYKRAESEEDIRASYALRYEVFCKELKDIPESACPNGLEQDEYDPYAAHFIIKDGERVVGVTRVVVENDHFGPGSYGVSMDHYYDLSPLKAKYKKMAEMGRTCFLAPYRGRASLAHLWRLVYHYVVFEQGCDLGLSLGTCWTDSPADIRRFYDMLDKRGFVSKTEHLAGLPGMSNAKPPLRVFAPDNHQPFVSTPTLRMYLDVGFRVMGDPVFAEPFKDYQLLIGVHRDGLTEPYMSFFKAEARPKRRRAGRSSAEAGGSPRGSRGARGR